MHIKVHDLFGEYAMERADGERVRALILDALHRGELVELDFAEVTVFASPFFNGALAELVARYSDEFLERNIQIRNLSPGDGDYVLRRVLEEARAKRGHTKSYRKAIADARG